MIVLDSYVQPSQLYTFSSRLREISCHSMSFCMLFGQHVMYLIAE